MNAAIVTLVMLGLLWLGYVFYGRLIERKCAQPDSERKTPAYELRDGVDYEPARPVMLFGHHFTNISGAGPIVGPVIAVAYFGWAACLGWILLGSVLIGAVHDYLTLMVSVRMRGRSISDVAREVVSPRASLVFGAFLWLAMVLVIAVFAILATKTLISTPTVVIPNLGLIPVAMVMGLAVYRARVPLLPATVVGVIILGFLLWLGHEHPISLPSAWDDPFKVWLSIIFFYCFFASVLPIWLLLTPRDYLSSMIAVGGLVLGFVGLFAAAPTVNAPAHISFVTEKGPFWPMLFILVACGAVSGFHAIVSGGTTAKQLPNEKYARPIGYGSMLVEAALAVQVTFLVGAGLYWVGRHLGPDGRSLVLGEIMAQGGGPAEAFIRGFGAVLSRGLPFISFSLGMLFAAIILNATLLDTLDTCTRLGRFVLEEAGERFFGRLHSKWLSNIVASIITLAPAAYLAWSGGAQVIWPVFGAANQLIAALALFVISVYLVGVRRPSMYTFIPGSFMLLTTVGALIYQAWRFFFGPQPKLVLGFISLVLIALALFVAAEVIPRALALRSQPKPAPADDG